MRIIFVLAKKEVKELLTWQLLAPMLALMLIFVFIGRLMKGEMKKAIRPKPVIVVDEDKSATSNSLINFLKSNFIIFEAGKESTIFLNEAKEKNINMILILPEGLEKRLFSETGAEIKVYSLLNNFSPFTEVSEAALKSSINLINESLSTKLLKNIRPEIEASTVKNPLKVIDYVILQDKIIQANPTAVRNYFRMQTLFLPIILLIVVIYFSQMIATAIGQEKENKTLEIILTLPISRLQILIGKMSGAGIAAFIISFIFLLGMGYFMRPMDEPFSQRPLGSFALFPAPIFFYSLISLALFLAIICAGALSTLLSIFAADAKQAQVLITPLMIFLLFPYLVNMLLDINTLPVILKIIFYLIPFTYPFLIPQAIFLNQPTIVAFGVIYMLLFAVVTLILSAKIFSSDRILTSKLFLKGKASRLTD